MFTVVMLLSFVVFLNFGSIPDLLTQASYSSVHYGEIKDMSFISYAGAFVVWLIAGCTVPHLVMRVLPHAMDTQLNFRSTIL